MSGEKWGVFVESGLGRDEWEKSSGWEGLCWKKGIGRMGKKSGE